LIPINAGAQTGTTTVEVGVTTQPPSIDGRWQVGEWENAVEYNLTLESTSKVTALPTIRLLHDNTTLYGLVDVPSDNGGSYTDSNGHINYGSVMLTFDNLANATQPTAWISLETDYRQLAGVGVICQCSTQLAAEIKSHTSASTGLTTTSSSNATHRIWEFSLQLYPEITPKPLTQNVTSVGFNTQVSDSEGNQMFLVAAGKLAQLSFAATPLPDIANIALMLPFSLLVSLLLIRKRRKQRI
jgi:hypothetical protein